MRFVDAPSYLLYLNSLGEGSVPDEASLVEFVSYLSHPGSFNVIDLSTINNDKQSKQFIQFVKKLDTIVKAWGGQEGEVRRERKHNI